jgi:hypothetical protein
MARKNLKSMSLKNNPLGMSPSIGFGQPLGMIGGKAGMINMGNSHLSD